MSSLGRRVESMTQLCQVLIQATKREASGVPSIDDLRAVRPLLWHGHAEAVAGSTLLRKVLGSYCSEGSTSERLPSPV